MKIWIVIKKSLDIDECISSFVSDSFVFSSEELALRYINYNEEFINFEWIIFEKEIDNA